MKYALYILLIPFLCQAQLSDRFMPVWESTNINMNFIYDRIGAPVFQSGTETEDVETISFYVNETVTNISSMNMIYAGPMASNTSESLIVEHANFIEAALFYHREDDYGATVHALARHLTENDKRDFFNISRMNRTSNSVVRYYNANGEAGQNVTNSGIIFYHIDQRYGTISDYETDPLVSPNSEAAAHGPRYGIPMNQYRISGKPSTITYAGDNPINVQYVKATYRHTSFGNDWESIEDEVEFIRSNSSSLAYSNAWELNTPPTTWQTNSGVVSNTTWYISGTDSFDPQTINESTTIRVKYKLGLQR